MTRESALRQVVKKTFNWYGSLVVPSGVEQVDVLARVDKIKTSLLENSILRVDVVIRLFALLPEKDVHVEKGSIRKSIDKDMSLTCFVKLRQVQDFKNVVSVYHEIVVDRANVWIGRVSVVGTLNLEVTYLGYVVLEGTVTDFPNNAPVRGVLVTVRDANGGEVLFSTTTSRDGGYIFRELSPGAYRVTVEADGYQSGKQVAVAMLYDRVNFSIHRL